MDENIYFNEVGIGWKCTLRSNRYVCHFTSTYGLKKVVLGLKKAGLGLKKVVFDLKKVVDAREEMYGIRERNDILWRKNVTPLLYTGTACEMNGPGMFTNGKRNAI